MKTKYILKGLALVVLIFALCKSANAQQPTMRIERVDTVWLSASTDAKEWYSYTLHRVVVEIMPTVGERPASRYGIDRNADGRIDIVTNSEEECTLAVSETRDCVDVGESIIFTHRGDSYERLAKLGR